MVRIILRQDIKTWQLSDIVDVNRHALNDCLHKVAYEREPRIDRDTRKSGTHCVKRSMRDWSGPRDAERLVGVSVTFGEGRRGGRLFDR